MRTARSTILERVGQVMRRTFRIPSSYVIAESTTSADVDGWDSLSHAMFIMAIEQEFSVELPFDEAYALADAGALADLLLRLRGDIA